MSDKKLVMFMASGGKVKSAISRHNRLMHSGQPSKLAKGGLSELAGAADSGMRLRAALASPVREKVDTPIAGSKPPRMSRMPSALPRRRGKAVPVASAVPLISSPPMGGGFMRK